jgi:hypothetical protein
MYRWTTRDKRREREIPEGEVDELGEKLRSSGVNIFKFAKVGAVNARPV